MTGKNAQRSEFSGELRFEPPQQRGVKNPQSDRRWTLVFRGFLKLRRRGGGRVGHGALIRADVCT